MTLLLWNATSRSKSFKSRTNKLIWSDSEVVNPLLCSTRCNSQFTSNRWQSSSNLRWWWSSSSLCSSKWSTSPLTSNSNDLEVFEWLSLH
jgi:hypothetical protein